MTLMRSYTGTSGFSYKEWKGSFYPTDLPDKKMLGHYATRLAAVEINNTFYRMPKTELVAGWAAQVGDEFKFVLKAPQRITHRERLEGSEESLASFLAAARVLGGKLGAVMFQLPPFFKKDVTKLATFLALVPEDIRAAFEFRHATWFSDDVYEALRAKNVALVGGDAEDSTKSPPMVATANFGYLRLRAAEYSDEGLSTWAESIAKQPWSSAFVFLKHEVLGPQYAEKLAASLAERAT
jgi:uncharacterized protein YecE (DUF72 family)